MHHVLESTVSPEYLDEETRRAVREILKKHEEEAKRVNRKIMRRTPVEIRVNPNPDTYDVDV
jgi:hypothetical protein